MLEIEFNTLRLLPELANIFAVSLEQLTGITKMPAKRGAASTLERQIDQINQMSRSKQKFIVEMLDTMIKQQAS